MNKKMIILITTIFILIFIILAIFTDVFDVKTFFDNQKNIDGVTYDFVKSHNLSDKTRIFYPHLDDFTMVNYYSDDFSKYYVKNNSTIIASIYSFNGTIKNHEEDQYKNFKKIYEGEYRVVSDDIKCDYLCKRYQVYKSDNSIYVDELRVYIDLSSDEVFSLSYNSPEKEISDKEIDIFTNNYRMKKDANYSYSTVDDDILMITLEYANERSVSINLNANLYSEVITGGNNSKMTTINDNKTNNEIKLAIILKRPQKTLDDDIKSWLGSNDFNKNKKIKYGNITFYEQDLENKSAYVYYIDKESALLIVPKSSKMNIEHFKDIKLVNNDV